MDIHGQKTPFLGVSVGMVTHLVVRILNDHNNNSLI